MPKITYIENSGKSHTIEVSNGLSVMEGAVQNDIPGIDADCGGGMACATCHVYVKEEWFNKLPKKEDGEEDMLDMAFETNTWQLNLLNLLGSNAISSMSSSPSSFFGSLSNHSSLT